MEFRVGPKLFELTKVNIRMRNVYSEISDLSAKLSLLIEDVEDVADTQIIDGESESAIERAKARKRYREKMRELDAVRKDISAQILSKRDALIEAVLVKNGYEYDREFWEEEADVEDINDIIVGLFKRSSSGK